MRHSRVSFRHQLNHAARSSCCGTLRLEPLEDRRLLAVLAYDLATQALTLTAVAGEVNNVSISSQNGTLSITDTGASLGSLPADLPGNIVGNTLQTPQSAVRSLNILLGDMNDTLTLSTLSTAFVGSFSADGGAGTSDTLTINAGGVGVTASAVSLTNFETLSLGNALAATAGDVTLDTTGALAVTAPITATGNVVLTGGGNISQSALAAINAAALAVTTSGTGSISLNASNQVGQFAAASNSGDITFRAANASGLNVASIGSLNGITSDSGDVQLFSAGPVTINAPIAAESSTVRITAAGGISDNGAGQITTDQLALRNSGTGNIVLDAAGQSAGVVAASNTAAGGNILLTNVGATNVGSLGATTEGFVATTGLSSSANVSLSTSQALTISDPISAPGTARLVAVGGVSQNASGAISAANLSVRNSSTGNIRLDAGNQVATAAAENAAATGDILIADLANLTIGNVAADPLAPLLFPAVNGLSTGGGPITVSGAGAIAITAPINAGATGAQDVRIAASGDITQTATGTITGDELGIRSTLGDILLRAANDVSALAASALGPDGRIHFSNSGNLSISSVAADQFFLATSGASTAGGDILLEALGALDLNSIISAPGGTVRLGAQGGINQNETSIVEATSLALRNTATGNISLNEGNRIAFLAASNAGSGTVSLTNLGDLNISSVSSADGFAAIDGLNTAGGALTINSSGDLLVAAPTATAGGTTQLNAQGTVTNAGGVPILPLANNPTAFVQELYRDILNREADPAGLAFWTNQLSSGMTPSEMVRAFWNSEEHRGQQVDNLYRTLLGREADPAGRATFVNALTSGMTEEEVTAIFLNSAEFNTINGSNQAFVQALYRGVLGREADPTGLATWTANLTTMIRSEVADVFLNSLEYRQRVINQFYLAFLNRPADAMGLEFFTRQSVAGSLDQETLATMLLTSTEFANSIAV